MSESEHTGKLSQNKRNRTIATVCVVAAVAVAAVGGFAVWHNQPSFCNSICHTPMNAYVESYYNTDGTMLPTRT